MKNISKIIKISLLASLVLISSNASAQKLENAIKNVDVSGTIGYRYNDYASGVHRNNYKLSVNISSKVNDDVKVNTRFTTGISELNTHNQSDRSFQASLSGVNFSYAGIDNLIVTLGKQAISTPWTVPRELIGNENVGTGVHLLYNLDSISFVGAYYNQTNFGASIYGERNEVSEVTVGNQANANAIGANDVYVVGAIANLGTTNLDAFYMKVDEQFDTYTFATRAVFEINSLKLSPFARYTSLSAEKNSEVADRIGELTSSEGVLDTTKEQTLWQLGVSANIGIYHAFAAYGESGKDGGFVYLDTFSPTNMDYQWRVTADGSAQTSYLYLHTKVDVTDKTHVGLFYSGADYKVKNDVSEVYARVGFKVTRSLFFYIQYGQISIDNSSNDGDMGRLHLKYSF